MIRSISGWLRRRREAADQAAAAKAVRALAHDVRRPFSILHLATRTLAKEKDPVKREALFERLLPELERAARDAEAALQNQLAPKPAVTSVSTAAPAVAPADDRPWIAVVDDNVFALEAWTSNVEDAHVFAFDSPSAFWRHAEENPDFLARLAALVTDYHFDQPGEVDGLKFSEAVRKITSVPIFLSSDAELDGVANAGVDARIAKEPMPLAVLSGKLRDKKGA